MKKIIASLMVLVMLAGCTPIDTTPTPGTGATTPTPPQQTAPAQAAITPPPPPTGDDVQFAPLIDLILDANPVAVLDPFNAATPHGPGRWSYTLMFSTLVYDQGAGDFVPGLATSWETEDWLTITMTLRDDVYFHNGDHFTAQDVIDTVATSPEGPGSMGANAWRAVDTVVALDDYTIEITLTDVDVDFLFSISHPGAGIINRRARDENPDTGLWIGTGAFYVAEFHTNDYIVFNRNDNYWGGMPPTETIIFRFVPEMSARTIMVQNNESQIAFQLSPEDLFLFQNEPENFNVTGNILNSPYYISFNMEDPITGDYYFRRAVAHAVQRDELAVVAMGDWAIPWEGGTIWGHDTQFRNWDIPQIPFDLDVARDYLERSSYNGESIDLLVSQPQTARAAEMLQEQLGRIGISISINRQDAAGLAAFASNVNNQSQLVMHLMTMPMNAAGVRNFVATGNGLNRASFTDPAVDELLARAGSTLDYNERRALYMELQELIVQDLPYVMVWTNLNAIVSVTGMGGYILRADNNHDLRFMYKVLN